MPHLVDEGQVPLYGRLVLLPLQPQLVAELLLGLFDVPDSQFPLLGLVGAGKKRRREVRSHTSPAHVQEIEHDGSKTESAVGSDHPEQLNPSPWSPKLPPRRQ